MGEYDQASHEYCVAHNITYQAYSTLHGVGATLPAVIAAAAAHAVSPQSVMMRWITQLGIPIVSASNVSAYDLDDIAMFTYNLTSAEMAAISAATPPPPSGKCDANPTCAGVTAKTCIASGCKKCSKAPPSKSCGSCGCAACCEGCKLTDFGMGQTYCAPQKKGAESWQRPEFAQQKHTTSTLLVTEADGGEGFDMSMTLVNISQRSSSKFVVVAGVVNLSSSNARALQGVGAELRLVADPPSASVFAGVDWVLLMPADNGAYDRAPGLIKAANDAGVSNALMISIMDVSDHAPTPPAQWPYFKVEQYLAATWGTPASGKPLEVEVHPAAAFAVLRTYFFQEHLLLWSQDVRATAHLRLPLETACFAPLHQDDGAAAVASMANSVNMALPFRGKILNLTGPQVFGGPELAQIAAAAIPLPGLAFTEVDRGSADRILNATGNPGVDGLLDLLGSQTTNCIGLPSPDFHSIVGREPSSISNFFANNADAFRPATFATCTGSSSGLNAASCAAWQDLAKATNITGWTHCSGALLDPCSCNTYNIVDCADGNITKLFLLKNNLKGTIPSSLGSLTRLEELDLDENNLEGTIPSSLASLTRLTYLSLQYNTLTGLVPPLPFKQYSNMCLLDAPPSLPYPCFEPYCNHFKCPLPAGSKQCDTVHCK